MQLDFIWFEFPQWHGFYLARQLMALRSISKPMPVEDLGRATISVVKWGKIVNFFLLFLV
jgi:hypothetical protein